MKYIVQAINNKLNVNIRNNGPVLWHLAVFSFLL